MNCCNHILSKMYTYIYISFSGINLVMYHCVDLCELLHNKQGCSSHIKVKFLQNRLAFLNPQHKITPQSEYLV